VTNPFFWGRQAIATGGREAALRSLLATFLTLVGEEAVLLYSGRQAGTREMGEILDEETEG
jgi:hypothetical protein